MTTKNMYTIMFDSELPNSPEQIVAGFKDGKVTYARIFECLCRYDKFHFHLVILLHKNKTFFIKSCVM